MDLPSPNPLEQPPNLLVPSSKQRNDVFYPNSLDQYIMDNKRFSEGMEKREINGGGCCYEVVGGMFWAECTADIGFVGAERTGWRSGLVSE